MLKKDFWYDLPKELIAQEPASPRDAARLMVLHRDSDAIEHRIFHDLPEYLMPGDLLVVNNSKVLPARIVGVKQPTGAVCELLLLRQVKGDQWECLAKPGKRMHPGNVVTFGDGTLTTNVDHCFQKAGFAKERLFYTQGDYGLFQCSGPCHPDTYDNREAVRAMLEAQGCRIGADGALQMPESAALKRAIPGGLVPRCPRCGRPMSMNLRADGTFVEDAGWHAAARRYQDFVRRVQGGRVLYWELGVGMNTPGIIKYNFWRQTCQSPRAWYACVNLQAAYCPPEIQARAVCLQGDIGAILNAL